MIKRFLFIITIMCSFTVHSQILPGAHRIDKYLPYLISKRVAVFANQTSTINNIHLVDSLVKLGINVKVIFGPEHGFRGTADAGEKVDNAIDSKTGIKVISLYGSHKKPTAEDLQDIDIMLFDIQDVGVRFYTFISSLEYYIEAAIEHKKSLIILDRPNPNRHYVDGPVLDMQYKSFVGMRPVPVVYGMTMGEYANMLLGERWLNVSNEDYKIYRSRIKKNTKSINKLLFAIITCDNYKAENKYNLPIAPSPNLKQMQSIYWYPSTCFFEGTVLSEGRGTEYPFQIFGHPNLPNNLYSFTPNPNAGAKSSKLFGQKCYGWFLGGTTDDVHAKVNGQLQLSHLIEAYKLFPNKDSFFLTPKDISKPENYFFNKLAGNSTLMAQIIAGKTEADIRKTWQKDLKKFKKIRKLYLLYK